MDIFFVQLEQHHFIVKHFWQLMLAMAVKKLCPHTSGSSGRQKDTPQNWMVVDVRACELSGASTTWYQDICRHIETDQIRTSIIQNRGWLLVHRSHVPQDVSIIVVSNYKLTQSWVVCKSLVDAVNVHWVPENGGLNAQKLFQPHFFGTFSI